MTDPMPVWGESQFIAQTKSCLTIPLKSLRLPRHDIRRTILQPTRCPYGRLAKSRRKSASKCSENASIRRQFTPVTALPNLFSLKPVLSSADKFQREALAGMA